MPCVQPSQVPHVISPGGSAGAGGHSASLVTLRGTVGSGGASTNIVVVGGGGTEAMVVIVVHDVGIVVLLLDVVVLQSPSPDGRAAHITLSAFSDAVDACATAWACEMP